MSSWATHPKPDSESSRPQNGLKTGLAHAEADHHQPSIVGRAGKRESPGIVAAKMYRRSQEGKIGVLPRSEFVIGPIGVEPKCHGVPSNSLPVHQRHFVLSHKPSFYSTFEETSRVPLRFPIT